MNQEEDSFWTRSSGISPETPRFARVADTGLYLVSSNVRKLTLISEQTLVDVWKHVRHSVVEHRALSPSMPREQRDGRRFVGVRQPLYDRTPPSITFQSQSKDKTRGLVEEGDGSRLLPYERAWAARSSERCVHSFVRHASTVASHEI